MTTEANLQIPSERAGNDADLVGLELSLVPEEVQSGNASDSGKNRDCPGPSHTLVGRQKPPLRLSTPLNLKRITRTTRPEDRGSSAWLMP